MTQTEDLTSQVDGVTTIFTVSIPYVLGTLDVHHQGVRLRAGIEFNELTSTTFQLLFTPISPDSLTIQFETSSEDFPLRAFPWFPYP